jgi:hypothetical protein
LSKSGVGQSVAHLSSNLPFRKAALAATTWHHSGRGAMHISSFDIFKIGIGPSSSHTVGPMRAAKRFAEAVHAAGSECAAASVRVELFGSLGFTGRGHGSDRAVILGLQGEEPATVDVDSVEKRIAEIVQKQRITLDGGREVAFNPDSQIVFHPSCRQQHCTRAHVLFGGWRFCRRRYRSASRRQHASGKS